MPLVATGEPILISTRPPPSECWNLHYIQIDRMAWDEQTMDFMANFRNLARPARTQARGHLGGVRVYWGFLTLDEARWGLALVRVSW